MPVAVSPRDSRCWSMLALYYITHETYRLKNANADAAAYLVNRVDDPADAGIATDSFVLGVDADDFIELVCRVLVYPVRVEDAQVCTVSANAFFGGGAECALVFQLVDALVCGLTCLCVQIETLASAHTVVVRFVRGYLYIVATYHR